MASFVASRQLFDREAADNLLALFDPVHFSSRNRLAPTQPTPTPTRVTAPLKQRSRTPSIASVRSSRSLNHHNRPPSTLSRRSTHLAPFLSLPPELLLHIFALAVPPSTDTRRSSLSERNSLLSSLARVHSSLRAFAQGELFHQVTVSTDEAIDRLLQLTRTREGRAPVLVGQITSLRVVASFTSGDGGRLLAQLVQRLPALETLHLEGLDGLEMRQFVLHPTLKHLTATRCGFRSRFRLSPSPTLSHLTTLSFTHCTAHDDALTGFSLPHLTALKIHSVYLPPPSALAVLEPSSAFEKLARETARQLVRLETDELNFGFFFPLPSPAPTRGQGQGQIKLQHLHLLKLSHLSPLVDALPPSTSSSLRTLHLSPPTSFLPSSTSPEKRFSHFASLLAPFRASAPNLPLPLRRLETLVLDDKYAKWLESESDCEEEGGAREGKDDTEELVERVERAGVAVRFEEAREDDGLLVRERGRGRGRGLSASKGASGSSSPGVVSGRAEGGDQGGGGAGRRRGSSMGAVFLTRGGRGREGGGGGGAGVVRAGGRFAVRNW
ncbi:hypothetical protein JCM11251_001420 [Rhodosporidiobolus azoricus]